MSGAHALVNKPSEKLERDSEREKEKLVCDENKRGYLVHTRWLTNHRARNKRAMGYEREKEKLVCDENKRGCTRVWLLN